MDNQKQDLCMAQCSFLIRWNKMATSEESGAAAGDDHDALDEVVLSSVNQALEAVENEALQESAPACRRTTSSAKEHHSRT